ncbi:TIGR04255 family protein [Granulosicoccus antarcticus]|uniref:TIGR04255 family protein n=1 Tax=Granulosicoccus antarcticus IMCC3135 TaxID=1192854 RepID=A0A2Z2NJB7_9GAMM|nr:TIGR04255 family protein [Granulosicoccus antarcticus]ASJ70595.1 hypothetical protein IMCC3135_02410 [Granulosicoccus antarcticus IMCC3135]
MKTNTGIELPTSKDFLYEIAPLVEVIAEIHWNLVPIQSAPGNAIDPYFQDFKISFQEEIIKAGFGYVEPLVPDSVPLEFMANKPLHRYRQKEGKWPLYQIGPGVLTINIVPPYQGWADFYKYIELGIECLYKCYPVSERYLNIVSLDLRYLDAFTKDHGVEDRFDFLRDDLNLAAELNPRISELAAETDEAVLQAANLSINLKSPERTVANVSCQNGMSGRDPATIVTFQTTNSNILDSEKSAPDVAQWFQLSHVVLHDLFDAMLSDRVKKLLGAKMEIRQ